MCTLHDVRAPRTIQIFMSHGAAPTPAHLVSHGEPVRPFLAIEQEVFTRSLVFPRWLSTMPLHIDAHELHHMYPFAPGYNLNAITYETENEIGCRSDPHLPPGLRIHALRSVVRRVCSLLRCTRDGRTVKRG